MFGSYYSMFYNDFEKFRRFPVEGIFYKNESDRYVHGVNRRKRADEISYEY